MVGTDEEAREDEEEARENEDEWRSEGEDEEESLANHIGVRWALAASFRGVGKDTDKTGRPELEVAENVVAFAANVHGVAVVVADGRGKETVRNREGGNGGDSGGKTRR